LPNGTLQHATFALGRIDATNGAVIPVVEDLGLPLGMEASLGSVRFAV
jgi:hypothetical protein